MSIKYYEIGKWFQTHHDASLFLLCSAKLDYPNRLLNFQGFGKLLRLLAHISQFTQQTAHGKMQCGAVKISVVNGSVAILQCSVVYCNCTSKCLIVWQCHMKSGRSLDSNRKSETEKSLWHESRKSWSVLKSAGAKHFGDSPDSQIRLAIKSLRTSFRHQGSLCLKKKKKWNPNGIWPFLPKLITQPTGFCHQKEAVVQTVP